jgi:3-dehydroquinate dehydratase-2
VKKNVLVLHGPNLNLLGEREPAVYGTTTLAQVDAMLRREAKALKVTLRCYQRNGEGELLDLIHRHRRWLGGLLINPGAYTHYSWALRDAVAAVAKPCVEVHLSDVDARAKAEPFRALSVLEGVRADRVQGLGPRSYVEGLKRLTALL